MFKSLPPAVPMVAAVAVAVGVFFAAVFLPGRARAEALARETDAATADFARLPAVAAEAERLRAALAADDPHDGAGPARFADAAAPHDAFAAITAAAEAAGVNLTRLVPGTAVPRRSYQEWPFLLEFETTYARLNAFLARLETGGTLISVVALTLAPRGPDAAAEGDTVLKGELSLVVYARGAADTP